MLGWHIFAMMVVFTGVGYGMLALLGWMGVTQTYFLAPIATVVAGMAIWPFDRHQPFLSWSGWLAVAGFVGFTVGFIWYKLDYVQRLLEM